MGDPDLLALPTSLDGEYRWAGTAWQQDGVAS